ncbi:MAG: polysulfide reductase NrfD, partial [Candidatus Latescibacteria bacterium]|nr:polysulfide reductase NrfD [Candidatus Latescibacterota bacterium]
MSSIMSTLRRPLIGGNKSLSDVTADVIEPLETRPTSLWWITFLISFAVMMVGVVAVTYQVKVGIGTWGLNKTVGWGFDITNFVFWIGIGHAGTLISAILFLLRQKWRTSINRSAEAMTLFAVVCAGIYPIIHMGRPWMFFWMAPYPNFRGPLWVNFRSPLVWDFFAISTYFTISLVFWYIGLIPDMATLRDQAKSKIKKVIYRIMSFGWDGSMRAWHRYETVYLLLAAFA